MIQNTCHFFHPENRPVALFRCSTAPTVDTMILVDFMWYFNVNILINILFYPLLVNNLEFFNSCSSLAIVLDSSVRWHWETLIHPDDIFTVRCLDPTPANWHIAIVHHGPGLLVSGLFNKNTVVEVGCNPRYWLYSPYCPNFDVIYCRYDGSWIPVKPTCIPQGNGIQIIVNSKPSFCEKFCDRAYHTWGK